MNMLLHPPRLASLLFFIAGSCAATAADVVAYCAQDQVYAQPIFQLFEKETGVRVKAVYDSEAVKTVGLANRLLAERRRPRCDVFWGNEEMRTRQLAAAGVFRETNGWAAFGHRTRRIVVNTNRLAVADAPKSLLELARPQWKGKVAMAYPQFGTTATHFHALRFYWGGERWREWSKAMALNEPLLVDGNSSVVKMTGRGEAWLGLTDSDDISAGAREGLPLAALPVTDETLFIPNTVAVVRGAPHPAEAQRLFEFLQRPEVARRLVEANALEGAALSPEGTKRLAPDWEEILGHLESTTDELKQMFLR